MLNFLFSKKKSKKLPVTPVRKLNVYTSDYGKKPFPNAYVNW